MHGDQDPQANLHLDPGGISRDVKQLGREKSPESKVRWEFSFSCPTTSDGQKNPELRFRFRKKSLS